MTNTCIRVVTEQDVDACLEVETRSFPPAEAAGPESISVRASEFPQGFLVAEKNGQVVGQINSGATDKDDITDEAFKQLIGHDPEGESMVVFSLSVLPEYRKQGIAARLMREFIHASEKIGKKRVLLLCKKELVNFYARLGFADRGISASTHGGAVWHEMCHTISHS